MEQEKINANVNQLSQKLLEGCKLLSESCPETNVPLVSTMDGRMYSVGNGCYYAREGSELVKVAAESVAPPPPATPGSPNRPSIMAYASGAPPGSVEMPTVPPIETQSLSSRVAAKLLEGFTLLSESCPVTSVPLVQDPSGRILSVGTGKWYERTGGELLESSAGPLLDATLPPATMPAIAATALPPPQKTSPPPSSLPTYTPAVAHHPRTPQPPLPPVTSHILPTPPPSTLPPQAPVYGSAASAAVANAVLQGSAVSGLPRFAANGASIKTGASEAVAVLSGRLTEATAALAEAPIREAGGYVVMIKDIALAIAALKAL